MPMTESMTNGQKSDRNKSNCVFHTAEGVLLTQNETEMTELTCGRTTAGGKMTTGAGTHVGP